MAAVENVEKPPEVPPKISDPKYVSIKAAAEKTGYTEQYLRDLYRYPGQQFAIKQDPRKDRSHILYNLDAFYAWINRANKMTRRR